VRVRQLYGTRAGEVVDMRYDVVTRALASGTVALVDDASPQQSADAVHVHREQTMLNRMTRRRSRARHRARSRRTT
jgi:hypothetical protein